jgi:hypothetical protein
MPCSSFEENEGISPFLLDSISISPSGEFQWWVRSGFLLHCDEDFFRPIKYCGLAQQRSQMNKEYFAPIGEVRPHSRPNIFPSPQFAHCPEQRVPHSMRSATSSLGPIHGTKNANFSSRARRVAESFNGVSVRVRLEGGFLLILLKRVRRIQKSLGIYFFPQMGNFNFPHINENGISLLLDKDKQASDQVVFVSVVS